MLSDAISAQVTCYLGTLGKAQRQKRCSATTDIEDLYK